MAAALDFQAIVDLVGDKLREVFDTGDIGITWHDANTDLLHPLYVYEHGKRLSMPPTKPTSTGPWMQISTSRQPLVFNTMAEMREREQAALVRAAGQRARAERGQLGVERRERGRAQVQQRRRQVESRNPPAGP
mgnify:CR=1 FL=1